MNSNVLPSIINIEEDNLKQLVEEVKETLATDIGIDGSNTKHKKFSIVDLWNCQKSSRSAFSIRRN